MLWIAGLAALIAAWILAHVRPRPVAASPRPDPWAGEVAEFRRAVNDWSRNG